MVDVFLDVLRRVVIVYIVIKNIIQTFLIIFKIYYLNVLLVRPPTNRNNSDIVIINISFTNHNSIVYNITTRKLYQRGLLSKSILT